ncbi:MAG TPA: heme-binding protein [Acidimicrobiia bacterium]|nr:heme-binding protein [Acidimicrobiia bacterium]
MPDLTLSDANAIIAAALRRSAEAEYPPMAVVVVDQAGDIKAAQREDGASMFRVDVALGKAWGAVAFGVSSRALAGRAEHNPNFFLSLSATSQGRLLPQAGAVLIRDQSGGTILGAVGASGGRGDDDEEICAFGVTEAGFSVD